MRKPHVSKGESLNVERFALTYVRASAIRAGFRILRDNLTVSSTSDKIKAKAREIGFHKVGIVPAEDLAAEGERLRGWLGRNYHGEMRWMEREPEKRSDPRLIFAGARSVIALALNYYTPHEHENDQNKGKISRYAWGDDYHDVVKEKLRELLNWIVAEVPGAEGKVCVDTAPIMDKAWAARAGLGWIGKSSNLITKDYGSWVFLGEILLSIELEYDTETVADHCGTCTACLDACPTGAIVEPYVVDSTACISYGTIELRTEELPSRIAENLDGWFYGCDICQDVCPWNRFEKPTEESRFEPRESETSISLDEVLDFTPEQYAARFRKSAIKRAKLPGIQRNARGLGQNRLRKRAVETRQSPTQWHAEAVSSGLEQIARTCASAAYRTARSRRRFCPLRRAGEFCCARVWSIIKPMPLRDAYNRSIRDLRISLTDRCNFRCFYCLPNGEPALARKDTILSFEEIYSVAEIFVSLGIEKIRLTGGEPLIRRDVPILVEKLAALKPQLKDIALTTNGFDFPRHAETLRDAGLDRVTLSLDSLRRDRFQEITGVDALNKVLKAIEAAKKYGFEPVKINAVIVRGCNDDELVDFARFARDTASQCGSSSSCRSIPATAGIAIWSFRQGDPREDRRGLPAHPERNYPGHRHRLEIHIRRRLTRRDRHHRPSHRNVLRPMLPPPPHRRRPNPHMPFFDNRIQFT